MINFEIVYTEDKPENNYVNRMREYLMEQISKASNNVPITNDRETLLHYAHNVVQELNSLQYIHASVQDDLAECHVLSRSTTNKDIVINVKFKSSETIIIRGVINEPSR